MGLETATYIEDLVSSNPLGTDPKGQGDNHLRLIKNVLQAQFPNLGQEALTPTAAAINEVFENDRHMPTGGIIMWSGAVGDIPDGWALCDGTAGTPNLVDRFIVGSATDVGGTYDIGQVGGSADLVGTTEGHALTVDELAEHSHTKDYTYVAGGALNQGFIYNDPNTYHGGGDSRSSAGNKTMTTNTTGIGEEHSHDLDVTGGNLPPYYALAFIIKT